ncbi:MAG: hypothetical protein WBE13_05795 [Candidatus Acidiferrum sp.]
MEPVDELDVNEPGLILMLVAPLVTQLNVLLAPGAMLVGLAVNEVIVGSETGITVSVRVLVAEPALFVAVKVYVVVADGSTLVEPLADVEVNPPGLMPMLVAPLVTQLKVLLEPESMLAGLAVNEVIVGLANVVTVMVAVAVVDPALLVAVSV